VCALAKKRVLVVDDDPDLVKILSINLLAEGFEVSTAFDGVSAVMRAHRDQPDLILLDIMMPAGDGFSVLERLKSSTKTFNIPIVIVSAMPKEDIEEKTKQAGAVRYFSKPFDLQVLINYIKDSLYVEDARTSV
jgi:DNA-binding response OmpR family regulator